MKFYSSHGFDEENFFELFMKTEIEISGIYYTTYNKGESLFQRYKYEEGVKISFFRPIQENFLTNLLIVGHQCYKSLLLLNNISTYIGHLYMNKECYIDKEFEKEKEYTGFDFLIWPSNREKHSILRAANVLSDWWPNISILVKHTDKPLRHSEIKFNGDGSDFVNSMLYKTPNVRKKKEITNVQE